MTSKNFVSYRVVLFLTGIIGMLLFIDLEKHFINAGISLPATNIILGTDADSEVLILTPYSIGTATPSISYSSDGYPELRKMTPVEFLNALKLEKISTAEVLFLNPIKNWIPKKDLPGLLALTDSKEPCASVALACSSAYNGEGSTVGQEALFMIEGCRKGEYPPALNSGGYDEAGKQELIQWGHSQITSSK